MNYKDFLKDKKIAVIGLGPHGEMIADVKFLLRNKAKVSLYDMRSEKRLRSFLPDLKELGLVRHTLGKVVDDELTLFELIIISPEISKKSIFLRKAVKAGIQIEYPDTLFFKLAPSITLIGVIGLYGKTTVAYLIYGMLKRAFADYDDQGLFFIDPDSTNGALTHLKKIKKGDVVLARIPESLMDHYHEIHISPHVAVVVSPISCDILRFQTHNNFIIAPDNIIDKIREQRDFTSKAKILRTRANSIPTDWLLNTNALHDKENAALALQTSELFKVPQETARTIIESFNGLKGHVEFVKKVKGIEYFNDACSINTLSTLSALKSLAINKNIVLILGGAYTGHDHTEFIKNLSEYTSTIILLPGSGTIGLRNDLESIKEVNLIHAMSLEDAVNEAYKYSKKNEKVLFSPGFDAVGIDISRKERGDRFVKAVRSL